MSSRFNRTMIAPRPPWSCTKHVPFPPQIGPCCPYQLNAFVTIFFAAREPEYFDFWAAARIYRVGFDCEYGGALGYWGMWVEVHLKLNTTTHYWDLQLIPYTYNGGYKMWPNPIIYELEIDDIWNVKLNISKWDAYLPPPAAKRCRFRLKL